ncbi:MAG: hypothetical protein M0Z30_14345 [Actinomycetota bacterium]|nr:hypothetical protein [Actinomycetota bacterium]
MGNWRERMKAHGEVSRDSLEPYRAAGRGVYDYVLTLDELRAEDTSAVGVQAALLAGWVAFALQVLGDEMLDADAALDPSTAHYVPKVTAAQVHEFYEPVQSWMARASAARANPAYTIDTPLPEVLPEWVEVEPCPPAHLLALRQAVGRLREYTESSVAGFAPGATQEHAKQIVAQGLAEAASASEYANNMWGATTGPPPPQVHEAIETALKHAAEAYFYLGQVIAMPALADAPKRERETAPEDGGPKSFLETMVRSYPQIGQRPRGGSLAGVAGGVLGGLIGGEILGQILGGMGGMGGGGWGNGGGGWDGGGGGGWDGDGPF